MMSWNPLSSLANLHILQIDMHSVVIALLRLGDGPLLVPSICDDLIWGQIKFPSLGNVYAKYK